VRPAAQAMPSRPTGPLPAVLTSADAIGTRLDEHVKATILESLSASLGIDSGRVDMDEPFADYGLDSITAVHLVQVLNGAFGLDTTAPPLMTTALFDYGSVNQLAGHLLSHYGAVIAARLNGTPVPEASPTPAASLPPEAASRSVSASDLSGHADAIAVVGMSGRFAASDTLEAFWQHLSHGTDLVQEVSRWDLTAYFPNASPEQRTYCMHGSFLDRIDQFDPLFFKISALEATESPGGGRSCRRQQPRRAMRGLCRLCQR
jgi:acyl carrier protein